MSEVHRGKHSHNYTGGRHVTKHGYARVLTHKGKTGNGLYEYEHRVVMEKMLGRALELGEQVHHKNGVRDDNREDNLELWTRAQPTGVRSSEANHCATCSCASIQ